MNQRRGVLLSLPQLGPSIYEPNPKDSSGLATTRLPTECPVDLDLIPIHVSTPVENSHFAERKFPHPKHYEALSVAPAGAERRFLARFGLAEAGATETAASLGPRWQQPRFAPFLQPITLPTNVDCRRMTAAGGPGSHWQ